MKTSEKLRLIKQIGEELSREDRRIINLTFEQFNIPISKSNRSDLHRYVLDTIQKADPETLIELAHHLEIEVSPVRIDAAELWKKGNAKIFISHLARDKRMAGEVRDELEKFAISAFVAHQDIKPSRQWQTDIESALLTCDALLALMGKGFHNSFWTDQEVGFAFGRGLPVIPVNMGESPYGFIEKLQYYKFEDVPALCDTIFKLLINHPTTSKTMSYAIMNQFENSPSFASSYQNLRLLKKLKFWDDALIQRLQLAPKKNDQIKGSFDVPEGVKALLKKVKTKKA